MGQTVAVSTNIQVINNLTVIRNKNYKTCNINTLLYFRPRVLPIPGVDLQNVFSLRTPDDANKIAEAASGKNIVIIGSSFIGQYIFYSLYNCRYVGPC